MTTRILLSFNIPGLGALGNLFSSFLGDSSDKNAVKTSEETSSDRGWGDRIKWFTSFEEGRASASASGKPMMLVVHKATCQACVNLKSRFSTHPEVVKLSEQMVMVNMYPSEVPKDPMFAPDGHYVPRIMFFTPRGVLMPSVVFNKNSDTKYAYSSPSQIARNMKLVINETS